MSKAFALGGVDDVGAAARDERETKAGRRGIFHELDGGEVDVELVRASGGRAGARKEALVRHRVIAVPGVVTVDEDVNQYGHRDLHERALTKSAGAPTQAMRRTARMTGCAGEPMRSNQP